MAVIFYHLGIFTKQTFPDRFDLVPLGGTLVDPQPLKGTVIEARYVVRIKGDWTERQKEAPGGAPEDLVIGGFYQNPAKARAASSPGSDRIA